MTYALKWHVYFVFLYYFMKNSISSEYVKPYMDFMSVEWMNEWMNELRRSLCDTLSNVQGN